MGQIMFGYFAETDSHHLASPEDWWTMVMGGGTRGTIDKLDPVDREQVKSLCLEFLTANHIRALDSDVLYAIARK
ncbi:MAG: hypothetical protein HC778_05600 [Chamaesiphon sp. CSU_1_12]|nr:hypothetical protein [Chamaesiphon sp. CSU_1_12]